MLLCNQTQTKTKEEKLMGIFDKIGDAKMSGEGNYVRDGDYEAELVSVKLVESARSGQLLAIESRITKVLDDNNGAGHKVGEDVVQFMKVTSPSFLGNVKQFISSSLGCSPDDVGKNEADKVTSDEQPLAGLVVRFTARTIKTQAGKDFTKVTYKGEVETEAT